MNRWSSVCTILTSTIRLRRCSNVPIGRTAEDPPLGTLAPGAAAGPRRNASRCRETDNRRRRPTPYNRHMPRHGQMTVLPAPTAPIPGRSIDSADFQAVPRPLAAMAKDYPDGWVQPWHRHRRAQLVYASSGVMTITTPEGSWVVPPNRALWIPAGVDHQIVMAGRGTMRTPYREPSASPRLPSACRVAAVSGLLRELILRAVEMPLLYDEHGADGRLAALVFDELHLLPTLPLHLPSPTAPPPGPGLTARPRPPRR